MTITVVSGFKRTGSSLMMRILQEAGIEPVYDKNHCRNILKTTPNPYLFEDPRFLHKGFTEDDFEELIGRSVKVRDYCLLSIPSNLNYKIIFMTRPLSNIRASLRKYKNERAVRKDMELFGRVDIGKIQSVLNDRILFVSFDELVEQPRFSLSRIGDFLGKNLDEPQIWDLIDPQMRHHVMEEGDE